MKIKNIALTTAQVGLSIGVGVISVPSVVIIGSLGIVSAVAKELETIGGKAIADVYFGSQDIIAKLEAMKVVEPEIVQEPMGDTAVAVN